MFPSKGMLDYVSDMNLLYSRTENDMQQPNVSPFNRSMTANRSSSSTDSTSPESYTDFLKGHDHRPDSRFYSKPWTDWSGRQDHWIPESTNYDTPRMDFGGQMRPIVKRKIIDDHISPVVSKTEQDLVEFGNIWQPEEAVFLQETPPKVNNIFVEQKNYTQNVFYELFSSENRGFEFKTPVKTGSPVAMTSNSVSPSFFNATPSRYGNASPSIYGNASPSRYGNVSPVPFNFQQSQNYGQNFAPKPPKFRHNVGSKSGKITEAAHKMCTFCRKNGETPLVYMTHGVKERVGQKQIVTCPILRSHVCETCGATGDDAHTITYCPVLRNSNNGARLRSTTITLKNTRVMSNGKRRY